MKGAHCLLLVWEIDWESYTQIGDFSSHIFFREPKGANACTPVQAMSSERSETPLIGCMSLATLLILSTLSKSDSVVITWSPSGYTPAMTRWHNALSSPCLLITTWQLVKAHGVTRNEPKIHVICYIILTILIGLFLKTFSRSDECRKHETQGHTLCHYIYIYIYIYIYKGCALCVVVIVVGNGLCIRVQISEEFVYLSQSSNTHGKFMNSMLFRCLDGFHLNGLMPVWK